MNLHRRGRRRKAEPAFSPALEKKPSRGPRLAGLGHGSAAARPLDGGVVTRWGAHAPARGPATAPRFAMTARSAFLARDCSVAAVIAAAEKRERAKREKGQEPNELGFQAPARRRGFYPSDGNGRPSDGEERRQMRGPASRPRRESAQGRISGPGLGCGLGAGGAHGTARARGSWAVLGRCSARCWPGRAAGPSRFSARFGPRWAEMKEGRKMKFCYYFPGVI